MSLPSEKTNALKRAHAFLIALISPYNPEGIKKIPSEVRKEARSVAKHFPADYELDMIAECKKCGKILGKDE